MSLHEDMMQGLIVLGEAKIKTELDYAKKIPSDARQFVQVRDDDSSSSE